MNTKRCNNCGKLLRADAEYCKGCGHKTGGDNLPHSTQHHSRPYRWEKISTPPASPHRAGHYSGLHPEDQPYQSSFMAVLRPPMPVVLSPSPSPTPSNPNATWVPKSEREAADSLDRVNHVDATEQQEPDEFIPPTAPLPTSSNPKAVWTPKSDRQAPSAWARKAPEHVVLPRIATSPVPYPSDREPAPIAMPAVGADLPVVPSFVPRKPRMQDRAVPILLTVSCLFFLVATSLLAFVFLSKRYEPLAKLTLTASPSSRLRANDPFTLSGTGFGANDLITLSRDKDIVILDGNQKRLLAHTDGAGAFFVQIRVSSRWEVGTHYIHATDEARQLAASTQITIEAPSAASPKLQLQLHLSNPTIDFGAGDPGKVSKKPITLMNAGGGQVFWLASSNSSWLTVTPNKDKFSGSEVVELMVNRGAQPGPYIGQVTFIQQGSTVPPITLSITMSINAAKPRAANLVLSTASLSYTGSTAQNPSTQTVTLQNSGGQPLDWSATATTGDGTPWLSIIPGSGHLEANAGIQITISVQSQQLAVGSYSGTISFQGGANPQISVTLNIVAPADLAVSTTSLDLQAAQGQESKGQIIIQDSGGQPLDWTVVAGARWLSVSPTSGHLNPGETQSITALANTGGLAVNSYQGTLTFSYGTSSRGPIDRALTVKLTVIQPPMPGISVQPPTLVFNTTQGINPPAQSFTITNIGNAPLNWATTEDASGATYAATSSSSSTSSLAPAKSVTITVTPKVTSAGPGPITALITIFDSDKGSTVPQQQVAVTINISSAAVISASPGNMVFNEGGGVTSQEELLYIGNTGSAPLNWSLAQGSQTPASWLSFDTTGGTIAPGTTFTVNVICDSSQLAPGTTYTATLVVSDSDPNSPVLSQTITVTLIVGS